MAVTSDTLRKLADLRLDTEQMAGVLELLAEVMEADEARRGNQAERKRRQRDRAKTAGNGNQPGNVTVTGQSRDAAVTPSPEGFPSPTPPSLPKPHPTPSPPKGGSVPTPKDRFPEFWEAYPRRDGSNPRKPAEQKFTAAVKRGDDPDAIIAGAGRYAAACRADGSYGTPYVAQAVTWLNQSRWLDYQPAGPPPINAERAEREAAERKAYWLAQLAQDAPNEASSTEVDMGRNSPDADAGQLSGCEEREFRREPVGGGGRGGAIQGADEDGLRPGREDEADRGQRAMGGMDAVPSRGRPAELRGGGPFQSVGGLAGQILAGAGGIPAAGE